MLNFDGRWRYESPGEIPYSVIAEISSIIHKIGGQGDAWDVLEIYKRRFAHSAGYTSSRSSGESWAESDLSTSMKHAAANSATFCEAFYDGCMDVLAGNPNVHLPPFEYINKLLTDTGCEIHPPNLLVGTLQSRPIEVRVPSMDENAMELIQKALNESDSLLAAGKYRPAVQEILWLLETVSTAFKGTEHEAGTVTGKYFNRIVGDLRRFNRGRALAEISEWLTTLHGYLSATSGGGIRHGTDINDGDTLQPGEAKLYCDLIRSYISYLLSEHARIGKKM